MSNLLNLTISNLSTLIKEKAVSPLEITKRILNEIKKQNKMNNTFITVRYEDALAEARAAEDAIMQGKYQGALHGIPLSLKDNISVKNTACTSGSNLYRNRISQGDAFIVDQLRASGAIILGKTNLDEFANHVIGKNETYGTIKNPVNTNLTAGGSSGGSAASVASNLSYASVGTDTSGSVRIPAACCDIVGLKPSYNLIPTSGVEPLSWSLDHLGVLGKDCDDISLILQSLLPGKVSTQLSKNMKSIKNLTIGIPENYFFDTIDKSVAKTVQEVIDILEDYGANVKKIKFQELEKAMKAQDTIIGAEAATYQKANLLTYKNKFESGNVDYFTKGLEISEEAYYHALAIKRDYSLKFQQKIADIDVLITPTLPVPPPLLTQEVVQWGEFNEDILDALSRFTAPFNMNGLPALNIPIGVNQNNLPIGLQLIGKMYDEHQLLSIGNTIMKLINQTRKN